MNMRLLTRIAAILALMTLHRFSCADTSPLYTRLGGAPVVTQVVSQTIDTVAQDPRVNQSFHKVNLKRVKQKLVEKICNLTGGGCEYTGDDMKQVHRGLKIGEGEFYALVEALRQALDDNKVGTREKNELLALLAPMKRLIVER